jgi:hypothetical protein
MEAMAEFFEWINRLLGVSGPEELFFHPVFLGFCIVVFIITFVKGWKFFYLVIAGILGGALISWYLYPQDTNDLRALLTYLGALASMAVVLVYFGFIRE